ncbi:MAG: hypothetical protein JWM57_985 [Phycisphaerales bacterium]|nr:hypothetical protein [Phycisphaerales bacterium]
MSVNSVSIPPAKLPQVQAKVAAVDPKQIAQQEATETAAQTAQEARSGDRVAARKLQRQQLQKQPPPPPAESKEPGKGDLLNTHA